MPQTAALPPSPPPRDLRLDIVRGWMQISIFVSHVAGTVFAWGIHAAWGLSDSSEQFVLLSCLTLGSVFALKAARGGFGEARADMARRTLRLYGTHLTVFFMFAALALAAAMCVPLPGEVEQLGWSFLVERPWLAVPAALAMVYQPAFMGILPVFVWSMLLLPAFLWLAARVGAWALAPSLAAWAAVQSGWVATPSAGGTGIAFEPLAWQVLFLGGALVGRRALLTGERVPRRAWLVVGATAVVLAGFLARLIEYGAVAGPEAAIAAAMRKEALAPPRLLHALALAYAVAVLVPRDAAWMRLWPARVLASIGRHSLRVFCAGLFLAWGASVALARWPEDAAWLDPLLVGGGACVLAVFARALEGKRRPSPCICQLPAGDEPARLGADGSPHSAGATEPVAEHGAPSASLSGNPNGRQGRRREAASPHSQGRVMDQPPGGVPAFAGIDVSKDRLDVHLRPSGRAFAVPRDGPGLDRLAAELRALAPALVVLEATGGFEVTVAASLAGAGLPLAVVNPRQIRDFARATGRLAKTDRLDAEAIALFAERVRPEPRPVADAEARALAELVARRRQIVEMIGMEGNRRRQARAPGVARTIAATLKVLTARGRPKMVAIVACMRRLLAMLNAIIRTQSPWRAA